MEELRDKHIQKLIEWLKAQGFTDAQILDCIKYITK